VDRAGDYLEPLDKALAAGSRVRVSAFHAVSPKIHRFRLPYLPAGDIRINLKDMGTTA
jgi:hypothetical protein